MPYFFITIRCKASAYHHSSLLATAACCCSSMSEASGTVQVSDQSTGTLEVRAQTDEAAAAGENIVQGFLTEPEVGTTYR